MHEAMQDRVGGNTSKGRYAIPITRVVFRRLRQHRSAGPWGWRGDDESGFTLIELLVALMLLALVLVSIAYSLTSAMTNVGFSRQQQAATGLADKAIEEIRGLPYSILQKGSNDSDSSFSADVCSSGCAVVSSSGTDTYNGETLVHSTWTSNGTSCSTNCTVVPLNPHLSQVTVNRTTYTVKTYVTYYKGVSTEYRVSAAVTWTPSDRTGASTKVNEQTVVFSPTNGCLSPNTHPYAAPCQPYFETKATIGQGYIQFGSNAGESDPINGIPFTNATLYLNRADSNINVEQVATLLGGLYTSGASINTSASSQTTGQSAGLAQADNDPASSTSGASVTPNGQTGTQLVASSGSSNPNTLQLTPGAQDTGNAVVTAAAGTAQTSAGTTAACDDLSSNAENTAQPCGQTTATQLGTMSASMGLFAGSTSLGAAPLASVSAPSYVNSSNQPFPTGAFAARFNSSGGTYCPSASGDGCVHAAAQRQIGAVAIGGLPQQVITDGAAPAGWSASNYLFQLSNYSDSASAENGIGTTSSCANAVCPTASASAPAAGQPAPVFTYWNGTGYTPMAWPASTTTVPIPAVSLTDSKVPGPDGALKVTMSASIQVGGTSTPLTGSSPCSATCWQAAIAKSPVQGDVFYTVTWNNTVLADLDIHIDLGSLEASTTYQEAPGAG